MADLQEGGAPPTPQTHCTENQGDVEGLKSDLFLQERPKRGGGAELCYMLQQALVLFPQSHHTTITIGLHQF